MNKYISFLLALFSVSVCSCIEENTEISSDDIERTENRHAYEMVDIWASRANRTLLYDVRTAVELDTLIPYLVDYKVNQVYANKDRSVVVRYMGEGRFRAAVVRDSYMVCIETDGNLITDKGAQRRLYSACNSDFADGFIGSNTYIGDYLPYSGENCPVDLVFNGDSWFLSIEYQEKTHREASLTITPSVSDDGSERYLISGEGQMAMTYDGSFASYYGFNIWGEYCFSDLVWDWNHDSWKDNMISGNVSLNVHQIDLPYSLSPSVSFVNNTVVIKYNGHEKSYLRSVL